MYVVSYYESGGFNELSLFLSKDSVLRKRFMVVMVLWIHVAVGSSLLRMVLLVD